MKQELRWYNRQLRIIQTVLREPDVIGYDAEAVAGYLESVHANCLVVNAGGIVDFFRHDLDTANPNPYMTNEDLLRDITTACHARGIRVIVRVDFRGVDKRIYDLHPDWFAVDDKGAPIYWANLPHIPNPLYAPCYLSYYRNEHAFRFTDILFERYDIDGVWENSPFQGGVCYCERCRLSYMGEKGKELPRGGVYSDSHYDEYRAWKAEKLNLHLENYRNTVKKYGEDKIYCAEIFGLFYEHYQNTSSDLYQVKDHFDFLVTPLFTANHEPLHAPSTLIKFLRDLEPSKTPVMLFGHLGTNNELRYVSSSPAETRNWMWQAVSGGGSLWNCLFNGQHPGATLDRRNADLCKDIYAYMESHEDVLAGQTPEADVAILYSRTSNNVFNNGDRSKDGYITHLIGLEQLLLAKNVQYRFLLDENLSAEVLCEVKVLLIPNGACLSDDELAMIRSFVKQGGTIIATAETSLYKPDGTTRGDFALSDVFGCSFTGIRKDASHYGYQYIREHGHPMTRGFEDTRLIANWGANLLVKPNEDTEWPISYVPQVYPQSPERAWPRSFETKFPTCVIHSFGAGRSIYFPYGVDREIWMHRHQDFSQVLGNALDLALEGAQHVVSAAPASVQLQLNRVKKQEGRDGARYLLHAINVTSAPQRPIAEIITLPEVKVELTLEGNSLVRVESLYGLGSVTVLQSETIQVEGCESPILKVCLQIEPLGEYTGVLIEVV